MKKFLIIAVASFFLFLPAGRAVAAEYCACFDDISKINETNYQTAGEKFLAEGCDAPVSDCSTDKIKKPDGQRYSACAHFPDTSDGKNGCEAFLSSWLTDRETNIAKAAPAGESPLGGKKESGLSSKIIPDCVLKDGGRSCEDVGTFVELGINIADYIFGIIGALALLMFVYGGFVLILSQGSQDKVKQGTGIMMAAVIGLIVAFGGYLLVDFLGKTIGLGADYKL